MLFGHHQNQVVSRIARRTYVTDCNLPFNKDKHDPTKKIIAEDGMECCRNIFRLFVEIGQEIQMGAQVEQRFFATKSQKIVSFSVLSLSRKPNKPVEYTDHPDVRKLGEITVNIPNPEGL